MKEALIIPAETAALLRALDFTCRHWHSTIATCRLCIAGIAWTGLGLMSTR